MRIGQINGLAQYFISTRSKKKAIKNNDFEAVQWAGYLERHLLQIAITRELRSHNRDDSTNNNWTEAVKDKQHYDVLGERCLAEDAK